MSLSLVFQRPERIPTGIRLIEAAIARRLVKIHPADWAQPFAAGATLAIPRSVQNQLFTNRFTEIQVDDVRGHDENVALTFVVSQLIARHKHQRHVEVDATANRLKATAALSEKRTFDPAPNHNFAAPGLVRFEAHRNRTIKRQLAPLPEGIVRRDVRFEREAALPSQTRKVERQHSLRS
jgi:hypothetical protein